MSKNRSIKNQLIHAISLSATPGESKRSYMKAHEGDTGSNVYSVSHYNNLSKFAVSFDGWMRKEHPDVRRVRDINPVILQEYMQHKAKTCNYNTLRRDLSYIHKLDSIVSGQYGGSWHSDRVSIPALRPDQMETIRGLVATQTDYRILLAAMRSGGRSESWKSLPLSRYTGFRVNETAWVRFGRMVENGGRWGCGYVVLQGREDGTKGGRWRTIDILDPEARETLREVFKNKRHGDYVISKANGSRLKTDSVMAAFRRAKEKAGYDKAEWNYEGHHAFRRLLAQESYDAIRCGGGSQKDAENYANKQLGHGKDRDDDIERYVKSRW